MKKTFIAILSFVVVSIAGTSIAELFEGNGHVVERLPAGEINWSKNLVRASGRGASAPNASSAAAGRVMAKRAAKVDAVRNLLEVVGGVRIDSQTTIADFSAVSDAISARVNGVVKGAVIVDEKYFPDNSAEVVVEAPISGILAETVYGSISDLGTAAVPKTGILVNTGLVIDAKGIGARPAMSPKVIDEDGREVYGSKIVKKEFAVKHGITGFANDVDAAKDSERVRANPIVIKALRTVGTRGSEIVIRNSDSFLLRDKSKNLSFLEETKVIIVME